MRQIVIDHARGRCADKRGGGAAALELDENDPLDLSRPESLLALDRALERLETRDPRLVQLLHYRVFAGLNWPRSRRCCRSPFANCSVTGNARAYLAGRRDARHRRRLGRGRRHPGHQGCASYLASAAAA